MMNKILVLGLFALLQSAATSQHIKHTIAGEQVVLEYPSPSENICHFVLTFNNKPFNLNGQNVLSEDSPHHAVSITEAGKSVSVTLSSVRPSDSGTFGCTFMCSDGNSTLEYTLRVYHPPGKVKCSWVSEEDGPQSSLTCKADSGYPDGVIVCYTRIGKDVERHTPEHIKINSKRVIKARFQLRAAEYVGCCAVNNFTVKNYANCRDFVHGTDSSSTDDDEHRNEHQDDTPITKTVEPEQESQAPDHSGKQGESKQAEQEKETSGNGYVVYIWFPLSATFFLVLIIGNRIYKERKHKKKSALTHADVEYEIPLERVEHFGGA